MTVENLLLCHVTCSVMIADSVLSRMDLPASSSEFGHSHLESKNHLTFGLEERQPSNAVGNLTGFGSQWASESRSTGLNSNTGGLFNGPSHSVVAEPFPRRSRPSFLDNIVKDSSVSGRPFVEKDKFTNATLPGSNAAASSAIHDSSTAYSPIEPLPTPAYFNPSDDFFSNASRGHTSFEHSVENKLEFTSQKQNEDFAALEQVSLFL